MRGRNSTATSLEGAAAATPAAPVLTDDELLIAARVTRGLTCALNHHGFVAASEVTLGNGRRADVVALGPRGELRIIEVKSSLADFHSDRKWGEYLAFCDRFAFAVPEEFPHEILPAEHGLWIADAYGAEELRLAPLAPLNASRRKAMLLRLARLALARLQGAGDPD